MREESAPKQEVKEFFIKELGKKYKDYKYKGAELFGQQYRKCSIHESVNISYSSDSNVETWRDRNSA